MAAIILSYTAVVFVGIIVCLRQYMHFKWGKCKSKRSMNGKTVIITGANSGLGEMTALELAKRGARVVLACRNLEGARTTAAKIERETNGQSDVVVMNLDLTSFASIRNFAKDFLAKEARLDVLINNAAVGWCPFTLTEDGFEIQMGVNHLGHFLLTNLLLDKLVTCPANSSRVIIVSSSLYKTGVIDLDGNCASWTDVRKYNPGQAYANSKLANILFARELARRVRGTGVDVLALSPGLVWTNLGRHRRLSLWQKAALACFAVVLLRTPKQGCQTALHCAVSEEVEGRSGGFFQNCREVALRPIAMDDVAALRLWDVSAKLVGLQMNEFLS